MKTLNNIRIIGIDHGYGNIKTANTITPTGVIPSTIRPAFGSNILRCDGMYLLIDKETMGREIRWKKPKLPVNDREKWRNRAVCKHKEMQLNKKSAESGCQSLSALFCC